MAIKRAIRCFSYRPLFYWILQTWMLQTWTLQAWFQPDYHANVVGCRFLAR
ncbi:Uncharacterized protein YP598_2676 [Yersinia pseudotuberculosis]|uniref:Uncharacterized protein n=1 Tax=Yersinia pseudotuberculosis serotype O:1b (strain IP 31758) TaxID=349747 RepID=A0A0U1QVF0_YERP3|nr:hypothetical protein YpsIP31758_2605 [Yersinia pseudotuberculosis IP 31758]UFA62292.1 Uncharacterized protein YP598_2676 [Yersinia pseudotuberculosis]